MRVKKRESEEVMDYGGRERGAARRAPGEESWERKRERGELQREEKLQGERGSYG